VPYLLLTVFDSLHLLLAHDAIIMVLGSYPVENVNPVGPYH